MELHKFNITVQGVRTQPSNSVVYLGVVFDAKLTWTPHLNHTIAKDKRRLNFLKNLVGTTYDLELHTHFNRYS